MKTIRGTAGVATRVVSLGLALGAPCAAQAPRSPTWSADALLASVLQAEDAGTEAGTIGPDFKWNWKKKVIAPGGSSALVLDAQGRPHVVFVDGESVGHAWSDGKTWLVETIDDGVFDTSPIAAAIDGRDVLHVAYGDYIDPLGGTDSKLHLRYAHGTTGSWQAETVGLGGAAPSIAVGEDGIVHIVHTTGAAIVQNDEVLHSELTPTGWETEVIGTFPPYWSATRLLVHDGDLYATFSFGETLRLATRSEGIWTVEDIDTGADGGLAFDGEGTLHVVYLMAIFLGENELRHAWRSEGVWLHETLTTSSSLFGVHISGGFELTGGNAVLVQAPGGRIQMVFQLFVSKGGGSGSALMAATFEDGLWWPRKLGPVNAGGPSIAVTRSGVVHAAGAKMKAGQNHAVLALELKGRKLALRVVPPLAGTITDTVTGLTCDHKLVENYYPGTEAMLTATPAPGFVFAGWAAAASGTEPECSVTLDKSRKVVARFEPLEP